MSPAVSMLIAVFLSVLLMPGGLRGATASSLQVYGKSVHSDRTLLSSGDGRHTERKQTHNKQQIKNDLSRSLDLQSFNMPVFPTTSRISLPTILRLYPPTPKPLHLHANMPMRFGRDSFPIDDEAQNSPPNLPQRFGRLIPMCGRCLGVREAQSPALPQRFGRNSLLRTLGKAQLLNTGFHWAEDYDFTTSSEEMGMQRNPFKA